MRAAVLGGLVLVTAACARSQADQCPDPAMVAPASVGGAAEVQALSGRLSGADQQNAITQGALELHRRDPSLGADRIIDILIAADCAGHRARLGTIYDPKQRTAIIAAQVNAILIKSGPGGA